MALYMSKMIHMIQKTQEVDNGLTKSVERWDGFKLQILIKLSL
jgi:hypothetical protein